VWLPLPLRRTCPPPPHIKKAFDLNWSYSLLGGSKFSGDRADIEGKLHDGHEVGSRRWGRAIEAMRKEAKPKEVRRWRWMSSALM
jgi:hypothetical protein